MRLDIRTVLVAVFGALNSFEALAMASALAGVRGLGRTITGSRRTAIKGLLVSARHSVVSRQEEEICPIPGGINCNAEYCCPGDTFCQPANPLPLACCSSSLGMSCNGGTACCDRETEQCCTTNSLGCCLLADNVPVPSVTVPLPPNPTETRIPKDTIALNYKDMLIPRKKDQDPTERKQAVDSLFKNMCLGMQKRGTLETKTEIFTYTRAQQSANRRAACGGVKCGSGQSCDEFPFASTAEGGENAIANCIAALGNSIQGGFLGSLLKEKNIEEDNHYELQLTNVDCDSLLADGSINRRDAAPEGQEINARQLGGTSGLTGQMQPIRLLEFGPWTEFDFHNHSLYYIGDLASGQYTVNVRVDDGIVDAFHIIDYQGFSLARDDSTAGIIDPPVSLSFSLPEDGVGITLMLDFLIDYNVSSSMTTGLAGPLSVGTISASGLPTSASGGTSTSTSNPALSRAVGGQGGGCIPVMFLITLSLALVNVL